MDYLVCTLITGIGATLVVDAWAIVRRRVFVVPLPNYALVGRWFAHLARGRLHHPSIAKSAAVRGELVLGWTAHYVIGVVFAGALLGVWGVAWVRQPAIGPALLVGIVTVAAPLLVLQPAWAPVLPRAARRDPRPPACRAS